MTDKNVISNGLITRTRFDHSLNVRTSDCVIQLKTKNRFVFFAQMAQTLLY